MTRPAVMNFHIGLWIALFFNLFSNAAGEDIIINPWQLRAANLEYENLNVIVGDSITFFWPVNESYSVSINPSGNCDDRGGIFLGDSSPISYTFTASDALDTTLGNPVFFADNIGANCEWGMRFYAEVYFPDSISPTEVPTETPTEMPTPSPTALASETPTFSPSAVPTIEASMTPTDIPTNDPTQSPTGKPTTGTPTAGPTLSPTVTPGEPTGSPTTANPTRSPTRNPTPIPTAKPTKNPTNEPVQPTEKPTSGGAGQEVSDTLTGLQMGMGGITDLTLEAELEWQRLTESFSTEYVGNDLRDSVSNFVTSYEITNVRSARRNRQLLRGEYEPSRNLQNEQDIVIVTYTQRLEYITVDPQTYSPDFLVGVPFETDSARSAYVSLLKSSNNPVLAEINGVSKVNVPEPAPSSPPTEAPAPSPVLSKPAIIGISCGGAGLLILVILFAIYCRSGNSDGNDNKSSGVPPLQVDVRNDEISTLGGPSGPPTYGDRRYVKNLEDWLSIDRLRPSLVFFYELYIIQGLKLCSCFPFLICLKVSLRSITIIRKRMEELAIHPFLRQGELLVLTRRTFLFRIMLLQQVLHLEQWTIIRTMHNMTLPGIESEMRKSFISLLRLANWVSSLTLLTMELLWYTP